METWEQTQQRRAARNVQRRPSFMEKGRTKPLNVPQALTPAQVAEALQSVRAARAWTGTKLVLEFMVLTAARSREVRAAVWDEIDFEAALWTVPAGHSVLGGIDIC